MASNRKLSFTYNAPVTLTFALVSFIVLIVGQLTGGRSDALFFSVYRSGISPAWFVRLFGHVLGHLDLKHFTSNMTMFLLLGPVLEEKYGGATLLESFGIVAVISSLVYIIFFPGSSLMGASGLVFMMIILVSAADLRKGEIPITLILIIVLYLGSEVWSMVTEQNNISEITHLVGGICGAIIGFILNTRKS